MNINSGAPFKEPWDLLPILNHLAPCRPFFLRGLGTITPDESSRFGSTARNVTMASFCSGMKDLLPPVSLVYNGLLCRVSLLGR